MHVHIDHAWQHNLSCGVDDSSGFDAHPGRHEASDFASIDEQIRRDDVIGNSDSATGNTQIDHYDLPE
jgi:hypothetical protein